MTSSGRPTSGSAAPHKPAELFRADFISAMKLPDTLQMEAGSLLAIKDQWRQEWEIGVQVCVSPDQIPEPAVRVVDDPPTHSEEFTLPSANYSESSSDQEFVQYDVDDMDLNWLEAVNQKRRFRALAGADGLTEDTLRNAILTLETQCQLNMARAVATEASLGIEYDETTVCDVCRDPEGEEANDMVFCDSCNLCVHQACYGLPSLPQGGWLCRACTVGQGRHTSCVLCSSTGGALKRVRPGNGGWAHISCAIWIPEVRVANVERMGPITSTESIPASRWGLVCCVCRKKQGACIQCSHPSCTTAFHVTCAFHNGLEMSSSLDATRKGVIHESYCPKHTLLRKSPSKVRPSHKTDQHMPTQLLHLRDQFYKYAEPEDLTSQLRLPSPLSKLLYNYWKLKRKCQHNHPLLSALPIESSIESIKAELALSSQYGLSSSESFMKIVHLRQNLEKARNLAYMIQRRERLKKQELRSRAELFQVESQLLEEEADEEYEREAKRARMEEGEGEEEEGGLPAMENHLDLRPGMEYLGPTLRINDILSRHHPSSPHTPSPPTHNHLVNGGSTSPEERPNHKLLRPSSPSPSPSPPPSLGPLQRAGIYKRLRNRDLVAVAAAASDRHYQVLDDSQLVRQKIRQRHFSDEARPDSDGDFFSDGLVLRSGPALNLRHRIYSVGKPSASNKA